MSEADSTTNVEHSWLHIFNADKKKNFKPFLENMTDEYVEENNIKVLLTDYTNWIATTAIPKYFDEDLKININLKIKASTLRSYIRNFIIMLKYKFPKHCD